MSAEEEVTVVCEVKSPQTAPSSNDNKKLKQMRLPFAPIQKESAINIQKAKQIEEAEEAKIKAKAAAEAASKAINPTPDSRDACEAERKSSEKATDGSLDKSDDANKVLHGIRLL